MSKKIKESPECQQVIESKKTLPQIKCYTCHKILENQRYVRCAKCSFFTQCLQCLSLAKTAQDNMIDIHKLSHPLLIIEPHIGHPLFRSGWDQEEEILLLYAVQNLGIGNWTEISALLNTKTARECEEYYIQTFITNSCSPLPDNFQSVERYISITEDLDREKKKKKEPEKNSKSKSKAKKKSSKSDKDSHNDSQSKTSDQPPTIDYLSELEYEDLPIYKPSESIPSEGHDKKLKEKNKNFATIPAEYSEFMPNRHEFDKDKDFISDAEILVADVEFDETDTPESFQSKIYKLSQYNNILTERIFRTKVIEEYGIHQIELIPKKDSNGKVPSLNHILDPKYKQQLSQYEFVDLPSQVLKGVTVTEKQVDEKLISLASYCDKEKLTKLADLLHNRERKGALIKSRQQWQLSGIKSVDEGQLFTTLSSKIKNGKITHVDEWNEAIKKYDQQHHKKLVALNEDFFTSSENELIEKEQIPPQKYCMYKDLIIREYSIHNCLPKSRLASMSNIISENDLDQLEKVYDLCAASGFIIPS